MLNKEIGTNYDAYSEADDGERRTEYSSSACGCASKGSAVEFLVFYTFAVCVVDTTFCVPDAFAVELAAESCLVPDEARAALALIDLQESVYLRVGYK